MNEDKPVTVFISYSHDSSEHKRWVGGFATSLRTKGIDVILDQWDTELGDDLTLFMDRGVSESNKVLIVCTEQYVRKADAGEGGVGYERMIVTSELVKNIGTNKFIPVIRTGEGQVTPIFLATRKYVDFRNDAEFKDKLEELVTGLRNATIQIKPPLGKVSQSTAIKFVPIKLPDTIIDPEEVYNTAIELARSDDSLGWRKYIQKLKAAFKPSLLAWRKKYETATPQDYDGMHTAVDEAVSYIAPPMVMAFAGIESEKDKFKDQRALFDEFYHISDWSGNGLVILIELPTALGFIYQALHGAVCMHTGQPDLALNFANMRVDYGYEQKVPLWRHHGLTGWPQSLGRDSLEIWKYISDAFTRWPWLKEVFGSIEEYKISLISYYMMLNFIEFAQTLKEIPQSLKDMANPPSLDMHLNYAVEDRKLNEKALIRIAKHPEAFELILKDWGIDKKTAVDNWDDWMKCCATWLRRGRYWYHDGTPQAKLMEYLGW